MDEVVDDPRFSRTFELSPNPVPGRSTPFKLKYADYGYRNHSNPEEENVLLFFSPLIGSRLLQIAKDDLAKKHKVRIINLDRPGIGGTDPVDPAHILAVWRVINLALLQHLGIKYISVACHSGGTVSAVDLLLHHPDLLHPERAYFAMGAPWALPSHTGSAIMTMAKVLPVSAIRHTDSLFRLIVNRIEPTLGYVAGLSGAVASKLTSSAKPPAGPDPSSRSSDPEERDDALYEEQLYPHIVKRIYAEGVSGVSQEAMLLLQKTGGAPGWGDWGDYDELVPRLAEGLRASRRRLRVDVFYAQHDFMIGDVGTKGPRWFSRCWGAQEIADVVDFRATEVLGADHDSVWLLARGVMQQVCEMIGRAANDA